MYQFPSYHQIYRELVGGARQDIDQERWRLAIETGRAQPDAVISDALGAALSTTATWTKYSAQMERRNGEHQARD
jgi:hypothetical protein